MNTINFIVRVSLAYEASGPLELVPVLDGVELIELVNEFERRSDFDIAGGYGGIIPSSFNYGPLEDYYLGGQRHDYWGAVGKIALLGCDCGEVGCWPLYTRVATTQNSVTWSEFEQPHRKQRDYGSFGPFVFNRERYTDAVLEATKQLSESS